MTGNVDMHVILTVSYTPPRGGGEARQGVEGVYPMPPEMTERGLFKAVWGLLPGEVRAAGPITLFYRAAPNEPAREREMPAAKVAGVVAG